MTNAGTQEKHYLICGLTSIFLLGLAIVGNALDFPYGYYIFLRFVMCGTSSYVAYLSYAEKVVWRAWVFATISVLYNPIFPFHLGLGVWIFVNILTIGIYAYLLLTLNIVRAHLKVRCEVDDTKK